MCESKIIIGIEISTCRVHAHTGVGVIPIPRVGTVDMIKKLNFFLAAELAENIQIDSVLSPGLKTDIGFNEIFLENR